MANDIAYHETLERPSSSTLFPSVNERLRLDDFLTRQLGAAQRRVVAGSVTPRIDMAAFKSRLDDFDFTAPLALDDVLGWVIAQLEHGIVHVAHPRYFGLFNPMPTFPAQCADRITAVFNPQLATSRTSPVAVEIEAHVIRAVARRAGLPAEAFGHFTSGGSEANYTALICALTRANPEFAANGARAFSGPPVFYVSRDSHLAWIKIAHQAGIGRSAVRLVATDGTGRIDTGELNRTIAQDRADGAVPVMVVATAGTTNAGMIDPLPLCAAICRRQSIWYHVDAAWGGGILASDSRRGLLAGIEQADSVTIDAHKWFATTMGCGMFVARDPSVLSAAFHVAANFMPSNLQLDPYVTSVQWSRRFTGLRLFLALAAAGWQGYAAHVERSVALIEHLRAELDALGWRIANHSPLAVLCVEPPAGSADCRSIVARVLDSGRAWVSVATFEGREIVRACVPQGETTPGDVAELADALAEAAQP